MKKLFALLVAIGLVTGIAVFAGEDKKAEGKKAEATAATDIELTGKIVKEEKASKKEGAEKQIIYMLEMADGKAYIAAKGNDDATNPEKFLDKTVTIKGKGITAEKEGKKKVKITEITSIVEAAAK